MIGFFDTSLTLVALILAIPAIVLLIETASATLRPARASEAARERPRLAVLVPAHDEARMIAQTIGALKPQLEPSDRLIVVADNCSDDTARIARDMGAETLVRDDPSRLGKGFALNYGIDLLARTAPPQVVVFVDADCQLSPGSLDLIARTAYASQRPVQADYLLRSGAAGPLRGRFAEFAVRVRNRVRLLGCYNLGWPSQLVGSGMAVPFRLVEGALLRGEHLAEDLAFGIDLALAGAPPLFCPRAFVTSPLPESETGHAKQKKRWEVGHFAVMSHYAPRLVADAFTQRRWSLIPLALDLLVPPQAFLLMTLVACFAASIVFRLLGGSSAPAAIGLASLTSVVVAFALAWRAQGRDLLSTRDLLCIPIFALRRAPHYFEAMTGGKINWERTERN